MAKGHIAGRESKKPKKKEVKALIPPREPVVPMQVEIVPRRRKERPDDG